MKIKGWAKVFKFNFIQLIKSKSFIAGTIITMIIMNVIMAAMIILPTTFENGSISIGDIIPTPSDEVTVLDRIDEVFYLDESGINPALDFAAIGEKYKVKFTKATGSLEDNVATIKTSEKAELLLYVKHDKSSFNITVYRPYDELHLKESDALVIGSITQNALNEHIFSISGVSEENYKMLSTPINLNSQLAGDYTNELTQIISMAAPMVISIVLFILIFAYGSMIAQSIATEKTSRVMELLLTSVRPLAVIIGKILSTGLVAIIQASVIGLSMVITLFASIGIASANSTLPTDITQIEQIAGSAGVSTDMITPEITDDIIKSFDEAFAYINVGTILISIFAFILGYIFYALIAGLIGASVSRSEDLQQAMQPLSLIGVLGFYLAYFSAMTDLGSSKSSVLSVVTQFLPISSPFAIPSALFMGKMSVLEGVLSIAVLALCVVLFAMVVAKVYESVILHNGERLKFFKMIKLALRKNANK